MKELETLGFTQQNYDIWVYRFGKNFTDNILVDYLINNMGKEEDRNKRVIELYYQYTREQKINELLK